MTKTQKIIEKWYLALHFPKEFDQEFYQLLEEIPVDENLGFQDVDMCSQNGKENLLHYLYFMEELHQRYQEKGISDEIFLNTMQDIVTWTKTWSAVKGELCLLETQWLHRHFQMWLFALGRLQFCMCLLSMDLPDLNLKAGQGLMEVHIPATGPLDYEECLESFEMANEFFKTYYPDFPYDDYMCDSWLLDETLKEYLKPDSNILQFQSLFEYVRKRPENDILKCIFPRDTTEENLKDVVPTSSFSAKIKDAVLNGVQFYEVLGKRSKYTK